MATLTEEQKDELGFTTDSTKSLIPDVSMIYVELNQPEYPTKNGASFNREILFKEYISTTRGTEIYNPEGQVQIFISNATKGHDISMINGVEQEDLYDRNTLFYVVNKVYRKGKWYILLEEL